MGRKAKRAKAKRVRKGGEGPRPKRQHTIKTGTKFIEKQPEDDPPRDWTAEIGQLAEIVNSRRRRAFIETLPDAFFRDLYAKHEVLERMGLAVGLSPVTLRKVFRERGLEWDHTCRRLDCRPEWYPGVSGADATDAFTDILRRRYRVSTKPLVLDPNQAYGICSDVHAPWYHRRRVNCFLGVCRAMGIHNAAFVGDFYNLDILSRFALRSLEGIPKFWEEMEAARLLQAEMQDQFARRYIMASNHELRAHNAVGGKIERSFVGDWLFGSQVALTGQNSRELDHDYMVIGKSPTDSEGIRLVHPDKGQLYGFNKANDIARSVMQHVYLAHIHEFFVGYAWNGKRIGGLGMLADVQPYAERVSQKKRVSWGFFVYVPTNDGGAMLPFGDGIVDWGRYGCK
jgi:hypothetical protein